MMKKILFIMPMYSLPVDASMGGAIEQLMKGHIDENEVAENKNELIFISPFALEKTYNNTKVLQVKVSNIFDKLRRTFYFPLRKLKLVKDYTSSYYKKAFKYAKKLNPDIIIFENSYQPNIKKFAKYFGKEKLYLHIHHQMTQKVDISKYFGNLISVSKFIEEDWKKSGTIKNEMSYSIVHNYIVVDNFKNKLSEKEILKLKKELGFGKDDFILIYVGRLKAYKGIDKLVEAMIKVPNKDIKLIVVGGSNFKDSVEDDFTKSLYERAAILRGRIKFVGFVPVNELYKYYSISNVQVVPTVCEEAAGIVALEGQAMGISQIITNSGGLPEYASKSAIIVERDDELENKLAEKINYVYNNKNKLKNKSCILYDSKSYLKEFNDLMEEKNG